jgi:hypothetical protein
LFHFSKEHFSDFIRLPIPANFLAKRTAKILLLFELPNTRRIFFLSPLFLRFDFRLTPPGHSSKAGAKIRFYYPHFQIKINSFCGKLSMIVTTI